MQQNQVPPPVQMVQMITGFWTSCCIYNAAKLNIADRLAEKPQTAQQLATATNTNAPFLYRLLRALSSAGVFTENSNNEFELTPLGETLRSNVPGSMKAMAIAQLGDHYPAWGNLMNSLRTGGIAFDNALGMPVWKYYESHPEDGANFATAMSGMTQMSLAHVTPAYDFTGYNTIVDIGGGDGTMLCAILNEAKTSAGLVYDEAYLKDQAVKNIEQKGLASRCSYAEGSFFDSVPEGGDLYVMKMILHDWNDEKSKKILGNVHKAMNKSSKLLIIESVIPEGNDPHPGKFMDINMMAMTGGKERTELEWRELLASCGLQLSKIVHTHHPLFSLIEAVKA
jgi:predicted transcriptional regulator